MVISAVYIWIALYCVGLRHSEYMLYEHLLVFLYEACFVVEDYMGSKEWSLLHILDTDTVVK
jgi:hypothetical protein